VLFADGYFTNRGTWAATGYGWFGPAELTAHGYCAAARDTVDRGVFPKEPPTTAATSPSGDDDGGSPLIYIALGAVALALLALFLRRQQVVRRRRARRAQRSEA